MKSHGILGVVNGDIAGGGDEVWEQAISELKKRFTFGRWEVGKVKFGGREVAQAADGSMRAGQSVYRVVRLAKAHTDLALLVCRILVDQICLVSYGGPPLLRTEH